MKPNYYENYISEVADELWHLGYLSFRVAWANRYLSQEEANERVDDFKREAIRLAAELGTASEMLESIAIFIAEKYREL